MSNPRIIPMISKEYSNLEAAAAMLKATSKNRYDYKVETVYFDFGQGWKWTTIICHNYKVNSFGSSWQVGSPRDWENIITAETAKDLCEAVETIQNGTFFSDK